MLSSPTFKMEVSYREPFDLGSALTLSVAFCDMQKNLESIVNHPTYFINNLPYGRCLAQFYCSLRGLTILCWLWSIVLLKTHDNSSVEFLCTHLT